MPHTYGDEGDDGLGSSEREREARERRQSTHAYSDEDGRTPRGVPDDPDVYMTYAIRGQRCWVDEQSLSSFFGVPAFDAAAGGTSTTAHRAGSRSAGGAVAALRMTTEGVASATIASSLPTGHCGSNGRNGAPNDRLASTATTYSTARNTQMPPPPCEWYEPAASFTSQ